ncbi:MAG: acylphosphatase [Thermoguttaceae bacterium]
MGEENVEQREIFFSGTVQGVGFRYTARAIAARHSVFGFVRNLRDGRVQIVVEGQTREIQKFLDDLTAEMGGCVRDIRQSTIPAGGRFREFEIRFE